ncbi:MAG: non-hydrolyzing UDP-N-acetylglucosamine 2-epimerase [Vulcanimicrobiota bacterium]
MEKKKVTLIFGTRPEAIKMAPVYMELKKNPNIQTGVIVTAQHREMLDQFLDLFKIKTDYDLDVMTRNQTLTHITNKVLSGLEDIFQKDRPDLILVQGDTTTSFSASLAAFYQKIAVGHIEAGLRTDDIYDPYPEEINRRLITTLSSLNFPPTWLATSNLLKAGVSENTIFQAGNTVIDALFWILERSENLFPDDIKNKIIPDKRMLLVETHRRENLGKPMEQICHALKRLVQDFSDTQVIFPVHKNPRVREVVFPILENVDRVTLLDPVDYPVLVELMKRSHLILTDSGGIQEEGPSLAKPVLVLRRTTERPEGIEAGTARLVGVDAENIYAQASRLLKDQNEYDHMARAANPYGDSHASRRIVEAIEYFFGLRDKKPDKFNYKKPVYM